MASRTGSRLAGAFLAYLVGVTVLVTLVPFDFTLPRSAQLVWSGNLPDALANIAMFAPLGFLFRLTRAPRDDRWALQPLLAGVGFSLAIEATQLLLPSRYCSPLDVVTNGAGAWLGALAHDGLTRRLRPAAALIGVLALELPLMGLVYLLIPLLWLSGLAAGTEQSRTVLSFLLGVLGAIVLGAVYRHRVSAAGTGGIGRFSLLAGTWFLAGALPGLVYHPGTVLIMTVSIATLAALWVGARHREAPRIDRRFEGETLRRVAPVLLLYLIALGGWPPWAPATPWHGELGLSGVWGAANTRQILRSLEHLAAFTVAGYVIAESRGRRESRFRASAGWVVLVAALVSALLEGMAARHPGAGASLLRGALATITALYGAGIYHLQRSHIRWLLRSSGASGPSPRQATPPPPERSARSEAPALAGQRG